ATIDGTLRRLRDRLERLVVDVQQPGARRAGHRRISNNSCRYFEEPYLDDRERGDTDIRIDPVARRADRESSAKRHGFPESDRVRGTDRGLLRAWARVRACRNCTRSESLCLSCSVRAGDAW